MKINPQARDFAYLFVITIFFFIAFWGYVMEETVDATIYSMFFFFGVLATVFISYGISGYMQARPSRPKKGKKAKKGGKKGSPLDELR